MGVHYMQVMTRMREFSKIGDKLVIHLSKEIRIDCLILKSKRKCIHAIS